MLIDMLKRIKEDGRSSVQPAGSPYIISADDFDALFAAALAEKRETKKLRKITQVMVYNNIPLLLCDDGALFFVNEDKPERMQHIEDAVRNDLPCL